MNTHNLTDATHENRTDTATGETTETDEHPSVGGGGRRAGDGGTYRIHDDESVAEAVVRAVGSETQTDPIELRPLHSVIDTEALNELFDTRDRGIARMDGHVTFDYCGLRIRVEADETVKIHRSG
jgi:hypothetical protein